MIDKFKINPVRNFVLPGRKKGISNGINKILFITLSNIGDVILTLPVLDILRNQFPQAQLSIMSGKRPSSIFDNQPKTDVVVYEKRATLNEKLELFKRLKRKKFDLVVDLRNTAWGLLLSNPYKTSPFLRIPSKLKHMKDRHMYRLKSILNFQSSIFNKSSLNISPKDKDYIDGILINNGIMPEDKVAVISPGARSHIKRWKKYGFIALCNRLIERLNVKLILVGDESDSDLCEEITRRMHTKILNLCARTTIKQLAYLLNKARLVITNDSAVLHLASYLDRPILAIFGPTDPDRYGPWSKDYSVIRKKIKCSPCQKAQCRFNHDCMNLITTEEVFGAVKSFLEK